MTLTPERNDQHKRNQAKIKNRSQPMTRSNEPIGEFKGDKSRLIAFCVRECRVLIVELVPYFGEAMRQLLVAIGIFMWPD